MKIDVIKVMEGSYMLETTCPLCGKVNSVGPVKSQDWWDFNHGVHVQNAFPYLSSDDRETLISGICKDCYKSME